MGGGQGEEDVAALDIAALQTGSDRMPRRQPEPAVRKPAGSAHPLHVADLAEQRRAAADAASEVDGSAGSGACIHPSLDLRFDRASQNRRGTDDEPREGE